MPSNNSGKKNQNTSQNNSNNKSSIGIGKKVIKHSAVNNPAPGKGGKKK